MFPMHVDPVSERQFISDWKEFVNIRTNFVGVGRPAIENGLCQLLHDSVFGGVCSKFLSSIG